MGHGTSVIVVPPHLHELVAVMPEYGVAGKWEGCVYRVELACGVCRNADAGEGVICLRVELLEDGRDVEAVDEQRGAAGPVLVREEMEELQADRIRLRGLAACGLDAAAHVVCPVRVRAERDGGVGGVAVRGVGGELEKLPVCAGVSISDIPDDH